MNVPAPAWRDLRDPVLLVACGFGSGLAPRAPGTAGTLLAAVLWVGMFAALPWVAQGLVAVVAGVFGVWLCDRAVVRLGVDDHPAIVWDEFAGVWLALWLAGPGWLAVILAVVAFRVLDIAKPWPVGAAERRWNGGLGVMADDLVAGVLAGAFAALTATLIERMF
ncbi:MAG: phosphatidylglycerophosphatase A [Xanthomonadaceae bacterium]|nr:phosphatidylglycerophosphatase A [Xanthomonadaceae bacterium]